MEWISYILSSLSSFVIGTIEGLGYAGIFILMTLESAMIPIPSEVIMPFSGFLVSQGVFGFWLVVLIGSFANLVGSLLGYWLGAAGGRPFIEKWGRYVLVHPSELDHAHKWFKRWGETTVFVSRMMPIVRTFISFPAGVARMDLTKFSIYSFLGAIPFNATLTYIGYVLGENWDELKNYFHGFDIILLLLILALGVWWLNRQISKFNKDAKHV
jgi:membrane protein DedA with SNARE-associated domain